MKASRFISQKIFSLSKHSLSSTVMRLAVASVALGVCVMIVSLAIVTGFKNQIRDKVVGFVAPIHIQALNRNESLEQTPFVVDDTLRERIAMVSGVSHVQATANKAGILKTDDEMQGVLLKGVGQDFCWDYFQHYLLEGNVPCYNDGVRSDEILVSRVMAQKLMLQCGDAVRVWFVDQDMKARGRKFVVKGIYETGLYEFDERFLIADINQIRRLNNWTDDEVGMVEVWLDEHREVNAVNEDLYYRLPIHLASYTAVETNPQIFDWLALLDTNVILIIGMMLFVAGITVISMLLIIIMERTSTIGLLKAMGASNRFIREVFLFHSLKILAIGMVVGNVLGLGFCLIQYYTEFISLPAETYYLSSVPIELHWLTILMLNLGTLSLWIVMLLIPTSLINRVAPSKSIRYE